MTRLAIIADPHIDNHRVRGESPAMTAGLNARCREALRLLRQAIEYANQVEADAVLVLGDLLDSTKPLPQVLRGVQDVLAVSKSPVLLMVGNHERVSDAPGDHSLGPLEVGNVLVIDEPTVVRVQDIQLLVVPSLPGLARDWLPKVVQEMGEEAKRDSSACRARLLALHLGLVDSDTNPGLMGGGDSVHCAWLSALLAKSPVPISAVLAGHWHRERFFQKTVPIMLQVGCLCPVDWSDPGLERYGTVAIYDTEHSGLSFSSLVGPRFVVARNQAEQDDAVREAKGRGHKLYLRRICEPAEAPTVLTPDCAAFELVPDDTMTVVAARTAAQAVRSAESVAEALRAYVASMEMPEGIDRAEVLARVQRLMGTE